MKKKSILFLCLIGLASFMSCSDKSGAEFEVSLEGQLVKTDANKGKWPKWMFGDNLYARDREWNVYGPSGCLATTSMPGIGSGMFMLGN